MDFNIPNRIDEFIKSTGPRPTALLLTENQYLQLLKNIGIQEHNDEGSRTFQSLYGLELIFTKTPIPEPRILKITN